MKQLTVMIVALAVSTFAVVAHAEPRRCRDCSPEKTAARLFLGHERQRHVPAVLNGGVLQVECASVGQNLYGCSIEAGQCVVAAVVRLDHGQASYPWLKESTSCSTDHA